MKKGFTLVELLVTITVFTLLLGLVFYIFSGAYRIWRKSSTDIQSSQNVEAVAKIMLADIRFASGINPASDTSQLILNTNDGTLIYDYQNGMLKRKGQAISLTGGLKSLVFSYPNDRLVKIELNYGKVLTLEAALR